MVSVSIASSLIITSDSTLTTLTLSSLVYVNWVFDYPVDILSSIVACKNREKPPCFLSVWCLMLPLQGCRGLLGNCPNQLLLSVYKSMLIRLTIDLYDRLFSIFLCVARFTPPRPSAIYHPYSLCMIDSINTFFAHHYLDNSGYLLPYSAQWWEGFEAG